MTKWSVVQIRDIDHFAFYSRRFIFEFVLTTLARLSAPFKMHVITLIASLDLTQAQEILMIMTDLD